MSYSLNSLQEVIDGVRFRCYTPYRGLYRGFFEECNRGYRREY